MCLFQEIGNMTTYNSTIDRINNRWQPAKPCKKKTFKNSGIVLSTDYNYSKTLPIDYNIDIAILVLNGPRICHFTKRQIRRFSAA